MQSEFGTLSKKTLIFLITISIVSGLMFSFSGVHIILKAFLIILMLMLATKNPYVCFAFYTIVNPYAEQLFPSTITVSMIGVLGLSLLLKTNSFTLNFSYTKILIAGVFSISFSFLLGYQTKITVALLMLTILFVVTVLLNSEKSATNQDIATIALGFICKAISLVAFLIIEISKGHNILLYGRLNFFGDIKPIAIAAMIPLLMLVCSKIENHRLFDSQKMPMIDYLLIVLFSGTIIMTAARGVIFAGIVSIFIFLLVTKRKITGFIKFIPFVIVVFLLVSYFLNSSDLRISRLFDFESQEYATMNGRTDIWKSYLSVFTNGGILRILFGFGPGDSARLISESFYAHSTFLDLLVSYGVIGFVVMFCAELKLFKEAIRAKDSILLILMIFMVVAEISHGTSANFSLFGFQAFTFLALMVKKKEAVVNYSQ